MIIGLTGKKQSGKSTAAEYIEKHHLAVRVNFKDGLVKELKEKFPKLLDEIITIMDRLEYDGMNPWTVERLFKEKPPLVRALMQNFGTEVRRADDSDHWVNHWIDSTMMYPNEGIVVDDVRFLNEAEAVRALGGIIVRIERPEMDSSDTHISELEMDQIVPDAIIRAHDGDFHGLYAQLDDLLTPNIPENE
jgi:dephospho-CoA kinase